MRKSKFTEEQIIGFLKQAEAGLAVAKICRKLEISTATYYQWKSKYAGMSVCARNLSPEYFLQCCDTVRAERRPD